MIKSFLVRKLADALSDCLTGITSEGVQAGLGLDTGDLDLQAGLNPQILRPLGLELLESRIEAHVTVPWRKISSQPTLFSLRRFDLTVRILPPGAAAIDIETSRANKETAVKRLEEIQAQEEDGGAAQGEGKLARLGHSVIRLLQVKVGRIHMKVDREREQQLPVLVQLESAELTSYSKDWASTPAMGDENMYKFFNLQGLLMRTEEMHLLGPIALEVKLSHMPSEQKLRLEAKATTAWEANADKANIMSLCALILSIMAAHTVQGSQPTATLPPDAGQIYAALHRKRGHLTESEARRLQEIEDIASANWIAAWRVYVAKADGIVQKPESQRKRWWWTVTSAAEDTKTLERLLDEAEAVGLLPEFQAPTTIDLCASVPTMLACFHCKDGTKLKLQMRGARFSGSSRPSSDDEMLAISVPDREAAHVQTDEAGPIGMHFELDYDSCELAWGADGSAPASEARLAGAHTKVAVVYSSSVPEMVANVDLKLELLTLLLHPGPDAPHGASNMRFAVTKVNGVINCDPSKGAATFGVADITIDMGDRRILMGRRRDDELLSVVEDAPIASLQLVDGCVKLESIAEHSRMQVECQYMCIDDKRKQGRNVDKKFAECRRGAGSEQGTAPSLTLDLILPSDPSTEATFVLDVQRTSILILPQLINDVTSWSLSAFQQTYQAYLQLCEFTKSEKQVELVEPAPPTNVFRLKLNISLREAELKLAGRWDSMSEYFQVIGCLNVSLLNVGGSTTEIRQILLTEGKVQRRSASTHTLGQGFQFSATGCYKTTVQAVGEIEQRRSVLSFDTMEVQPWETRVTLGDYSVLMSSLMQLIQMDAVSAEPKEELMTIVNPSARPVQREIGAIVERLRTRFESAATAELEQYKSGQAVDTMKVQPEESRVTLGDYSVLMSSLMQLAQMDAVTTGPKEELMTIINPTARPVRRELNITGSAKVGSIVALLLAERGGNRPVIRCRFECPVLTFNLTRVYGTDSPLQATLDVNRLQVAIHAFNDRSSSWEPLLAPLSVNLRGTCGKNEERGKEGQAKATLSVDAVEPVHLVLSPHIIHTSAALLPSLLGSRVQVKQDQVTEMVHGLNLSGVDCVISSLDSTGDRSCEVSFDASGELLVLDELLQRDEHDQDGAMLALPPLMLRATGIPANPLQIMLPSEEVYLWNTGEGEILVRILMPHPPRRIIVLTSTVTIVNMSSADLEVMFADAEDKESTPLTCRAMSAPLLHLEAELERPNMQPILPHDAKLSYDIKVEVLSAMGLVVPGTASRLSGGGFEDLSMTPYVVVNVMNYSAQTTAMRVARGDAIFDEHIILNIPEVDNVQSLYGKDVTLTVRSLQVAAGFGDETGDPVVGAAEVQLGKLELEGIPVQKTVELKDPQGNSAGSLKVMIHVRPSLAATKCSTRGPRRSDTAGHVLPWGHIMSVPLNQLQPDAGPSPRGSGGGNGDVQGLATCSLKVRAASDSRQHSRWGPTFSIAGIEEVAVLSSPADLLEGDESSNLDGHVAVRRRTSGRHSEVWLEAPVYIANACPCKVSCAIGHGESLMKKVGHLSFHCQEQDLLTMLDGCGGRWDVGPNEQIYISPLRLDAEQNFAWYAPYVESHATDSQKKTFSPWKANAMHVRRQGANIHATMFMTKAHKDNLAFEPHVEQRRLDLEPHKEYAYFCNHNPFLMLSLALQLQGQKGQTTTWSDPIPVHVPPRAPNQCNVRLKNRWQDAIQLEILRQPDSRRIVIFASNWFTDSTGLNVGVSLKQQGSALPSFGNNICLMNEVQKIYLTLPQTSPVEAEVPVRGTGTRVALSGLHDCILMVDMISARTTFDVECRLLTLTPRLMVFSQVDDYEVGFCQAAGTKAGADGGAAAGAEPIWLSKGGSAPLFWQAATGSKGVVIALRRATKTGADAVKAPRLTKDLLHGPFAADEDGLGVFPLNAKVVPSSAELVAAGSAPADEARKSTRADAIRKLISVQVNQAGQLFTMTVAGEKHCHQLVNMHPSLSVKAEFVGEKLPFVAEYGQQVALGQCQPPAGGTNAKEQVVLMMRDVSVADGRHRRVTIDLDKTSGHRHTKAPALLVNVRLLARVAIITVEPLVRAEPAAVQQWNFQVNTSMPFLCCSIMTEHPYTEVFSATLEDLTIQATQNALGQRGSKTELKRLQLDLHRPSSFVIAASSTSPALQFSLWRDDVTSRDVFVRNIRLEAGEFEVTAFDTLVEELARVSNELMTQHSGLELEAVFKRAWNRFDLAVGSPQPSLKYVVEKMVLDKTHLIAFCCLTPKVLPHWLAQVVEFTSGFAQTIEIEGAKVNLDELKLQKFKGSLDGLLLQIRKQYSDQWIQNLPALLQNSNVFFRGVFSRKFWLPKARNVVTVRRPPLRVEGGIILYDPPAYTIYAFDQGTSIGSEPCRFVFGGMANKGGPWCGREGNPHSVQKWTITRDDKSQSQRFVVRLLRGDDNCLSVRTPSSSSSGASSASTLCLAPYGEKDTSQMWEIEAVEVEQDWYTLSMEVTVRTSTSHVFLSVDVDHGNDSARLSLASTNDGTGRQLWNIPRLKRYMTLADAKDNFLDLQSEPDLLATMGKQIGTVAADGGQQLLTFASYCTGGLSDHGIQAAQTVSNSAMDFGMGMATGVYRYAGSGFGAISQGLQGLQEDRPADTASRHLTDFSQGISQTFRGFGRSFGFGSGQDER